MSFKAKLAPALTLENAKAWQAETDKAVWVIDNILDPNDVHVTDSRIDYVELIFGKLLADDLLTDFNYVGSYHHY